ncbi:MAG: metal-dependent hydrolase, partial [Candidatus Heimdallarchaeota archaeon]|nr:metal-dependent hydrolase [Candidatus Heimdallarchaeota archaeon]
MFPIFHVFLPLITWELLSPKLEKLHVSRFWLIIGSILPDLVDKPLSMLFPTIFSGRGIAHAPFIILIFCGILRLTVKRKEIAISLGIGIAFHILLDLPGNIPWFWPFVEYPIFPADIDSYFYTLFHNHFIITTELIGLVGGVMILWKNKILFYRKVIVGDEL